jgi:hypothetical protein
MFDSEQCRRTDLCDSAQCPGRCGRTRCLSGAFVVARLRGLTTRVSDADGTAPPRRTSRAVKRSRACPGGAPIPLAKRPHSAVRSSHQLTAASTALLQHCAARRRPAQRGLSTNDMRRLCRPSSIRRCDDGNELAVGAADTVCYGERAQAIQTRIAVRCIGRVQLIACADPLSARGCPRAAATTRGL